MNSIQLSKTQKQMLKRGVAELLRPLDFMRKNPARAMRAPQESLARMKRQIDEAVTEWFEHASPDVFLRRLFDLLPVEAPALEREVARHIASERAELAIEEVASELLALYDRAHANGPIAPYLLFVAHPLEEDFIDHATVARKLRESEQTRGERQADLVCEAAAALIEKPYQRYLRAVAAMSELAAARWPLAPAPALGRLLNETVARLPASQKLVDPDAAHIRNSVQHFQKEYDPKTRTLRLYERGSPRPSATPWEQTFAIPELRARVERLAAASISTFARLRALGLCEHFHRAGFYRLLPDFKAALSGDKDAAERVSEPRLEQAFVAGLVRGPTPAGYDPWFLPNARSTR